MQIKKKKILGSKKITEKRLDATLPELQILLLQRPRLNQHTRDEQSLAFASPRWFSCCRSPRGVQEKKALPDAHGSDFHESNLFCGVELSQGISEPERFVPKPRSACEQRRRPGCWRCMVAPRTLLSRLGRSTPVRISRRTTRVAGLDCACQPLVLIFRAHSLAFPPSRLVSLVSVGHRRLPQRGVQLSAPCTGDHLSTGIPRFFTNGRKLLFSYFVEGKKKKK